MSLGISRRNARGYLNRHHADSVCGRSGGEWGAEEILSPLLAQYFGEGKAIADFLTIELVALPPTYAMW